MKFAPKYLSKKVSAALVYTMIMEYLNYQNKKYISDGERSVRHNTNFQEYLMKYFGFRMACCILHVRYRPLVNMCVKVLYPFRGIIKRFTKYAVINNVYVILIIESVRRNPGY